MVDQNFLGLQLNIVSSVPPKKRFLEFLTACLQSLEWLETFAYESVLLRILALE